MSIRQKIYDNFYGTTVPMSGYNPHYESRYSTFTDILSVLRPKLKENGLFFTQVPISSEGAVGVRTVVLDIESGEELASDLLFPVEAGKVNAVQEGAKNLTFLKRVSLPVIFGLISEEDDGAYADGHDPKPKPKAKPQAAPQAKPQAKPQSKPAIVPAWKLADAHPILQEFLVGKTVGYVNSVLGEFDKRYDVRHTTNLSKEQEEELAATVATEVVKAAKAAAAAKK